MNSVKIFSMIYILSKLDIILNKSVHVVLSSAIVNISGSLNIIIIENLTIC